MSGKFFAFHDLEGKARASNNGRRWVRPSDWLLHHLVLLLALLIAIYAGMMFERFTPGAALRHVAALPSCQLAYIFGVDHALAGEPGYWAIHDPDRDGIACE